MRPDSFQWEFTIGLDLMTTVVHKHKSAKTKVARKKKYKKSWKEDEGEEEELASNERLIFLFGPLNGKAEENGKLKCWLKKLTFRFDGLKFEGQKMSQKHFVEL